MVIAGPGSRLPATAGEFLRLERPGVAKAAVNFRLTVESSGTRLTTETRVYATDELARRRFAAYWRLLYPGSSLIRYEWLRAIRLHAEAAVDRQRRGAGPRS